MRAAGATYRFLSRLSGRGLGTARVVAADACYRTHARVESAIKDLNDNGWSSQPMTVIFRRWRDAGWTVLRYWEHHLCDDIVHEIVDLDRASTRGFNLQSVYVNERLEAPTQ